ncbi:MAG: hypothetical protein GDA43_04430 [Hormoscilla sp. SP5CHS1]|nr:hypothetical protein [Hormoscilla sp. SP12CHS1]MBC6452530.1 hypothetical protein [Hormoscilla sp. SP5CHS1]
MKCIQCDTDNNLQDRTASQGRCKNCGHPFVFDPQAGSQFTDIFFNNALKAISVENSLYSQTVFLCLREAFSQKKSYFFTGSYNIALLPASRSSWSFGEYK